MVLVDIANLLVLKSENSYFESCFLILKLMKRVARCLNLCNCVEIMLVGLKR